MIDTNALLLCDTYKTCHDRMYPNSLKTLVSYWVPRKSMFQNEENQKMVFFGLQAFIQEYLVEYFNKNFFEVPLEDVLTTYRKYLNIQLGEGNYDIEKIVNLHTLGYLPLRIDALPEGSKVKANAADRGSTKKISKKCSWNGIKNRPIPCRKSPI